VTPADGPAAPTDEIWDYFLHSNAEACARAFCDPARSAEYARFYGDWTAEHERQAEGNREMAARLLWKPYMRSHTLPALLPAIATPTLVVWGREDAIVPVTACDRWVRAIPGARARRLEGCGHVPEMERPDEFVAIVREFLGPHASGGT
jgi:pimeloyl-ACP methyl ester carboxylesterase